MENKTFQLKFNNEYFIGQDIIDYPTVSYSAKIISKPTRKWYQVLFQYITFGIYHADYTYTLQILDEPKFNDYGK